MTWRRDVADWAIALAAVLVAIPVAGLLALAAFLAMVGMVTGR